MRGGGAPVGLRPCGAEAVRLLLRQLKGLPSEEGRLGWSRCTGTQSKVELSSLSKRSGPMDECSNDTSASKCAILVRKEQPEHGKESILKPQER